MYSDPSGNFAITALIVGVVAGMIIGTGTSIVTQAASNHWDWNDINYGLVINDAIFGGISGALAVSGLGMFGSALSGGVLGGFIPSSGFNAKNLNGIWKTSTAKLATAQSAKKIAMYQGKQAIVKSTIIKGSIGYILSTIGTSGVSYVFDELGIY